MGSQPWKEAQLRRWDDEFDNRIVRIEGAGRMLNRHDETATLDPIEGRYMGSGATGGLPCVWLHARPDMAVRDDGFWDHEYAVTLKRGMTVALALPRNLATTEET